MNASPVDTGWQWLLFMSLCIIALPVGIMQLQGRQSKTAKYQAPSSPEDGSETRGSPSCPSTTLASPLPLPDTAEINLRLSGLAPETTKAEVGQLVRELRVHASPIYWPMPGANDKSMVKTLTQSLDGENWVATVRFHPTHAVGNTSREDKQLSGQITFRDRVVRYDEAFHHATPLFPQGAAGDEIANIFAITGLGGRPIDSWKGNSVMWLRDFLGQDLQRKGFPTRIFTYGYPSQLTADGNTDTLRRYAERLLDELMRLRRQQSETGGLRPLVFVTHSFGGLILKQALKIASHERRDKEEYKALCRSIILIVFMGVPNLGLENTAFLEMTQNQTNEGLMELIGFGSEYLRELDGDFRSFRQSHSDCKVLVVYETRFSPAFKSQPNGRKIMRVPEWSACSPGLGTDVKSIPSSTDHSGLAKFQSHDDIVYGEIVANIMTSLKGTALVPTNSKTISLKPFHGRQHIINTIHRCLSSDDEDGNVAHVIVLCDFAGTGKTAVAQKYATEHGSAYAAVVWIHANSEDSLRNGYVEWEKISKLPGKVLLVYDGLDDEVVLDKVKKFHSLYWIKSIRVLITSSNKRSLELAPPENVKQVGPLGCEDSQRLISSLRSRDKEAGDEEILSKLVQSLDGWPSGLCAAAKMTNDGHSISSIMRWIREEGFLSHDHETSPSSSVSNAFEKNMKSLGPRVTERASVLFTLCAFLGGEVPNSMFELAFAFFQTASNDSRYSGMWKLILSVLHVPSPNMVCVHSEFVGFLRFNLIEDRKGVWVQPRAVSMWARNKPAEIRKSYILMAATFLYMQAERQRLTGGEGARVDTKHVWGEHFRLVRYVDHLIDYCNNVLGLDFASIVPIQCVTTFAAWYVHGNTKRDQARTMLRTALRKSDEKGTNRIGPSLSEDELWAILHATDARRILAWADRVSGELQEAEKQQDCAIDWLHKLEKQRLSPLISRVAEKEVTRALGELATIYRDQARRRSWPTSLEDALEKQGEALRVAKKVFGYHSSEARHERACLANLHRFAGDLGETLLHDQENLDSWLSHPTPGQRHQSEGRKLKANLATTHYDRKEYLDAIELEEEVLNEVQAHRGPRHPETATAMYRLARTCSEAGTRLDDAIHLVKQAVESHEQFGCEEYERKEAANLKADLLRERAPRRASTY